MTESAHAKGSTGYRELLVSNRDFRRLWVGQLISQTGDWFNSVALFTMMLNLTGKSESVGYILIIKLLPTFFLGPFAGVVADRFNRKAIMILSDVLRGLLVLGYLFIKSEDQVWIVYLLTALQVAGTSFYEPANSAAIPMIVPRRGLITANALASVSWSVTLSLGAAAGGLVTDALGRDTAFVIDSISFFISAAFIWFVRIPRLPARSDLAEKKLSFADMTGLKDMIEGARYLRSNPSVVIVLLVKSGWGVGGGVLLLLTIFGKQIFPIGRDGSASIGLLYAARGLGAFLGPVTARLFTGSSLRTMRRAITIAFFLSSAFYLMFAHSPYLAVAALCVMGAHAGGSIQWTFSTTLLQMTAENRFLGRVFAIEQALVMLVISASTFLTGWGIDHAGLSARQMATVLGLSFIIPGLMWMIAERKLKAVSEEAEPQTVARTESAD
ncbi:MAG: MFS transporter [Acidobacteriota bacterium]